MLRALLLVVVLLSVGCKDDFTQCVAVDPEALALPSRLSETGLEGAVPFTPAFELWSDGAEKRRFILLPPGERIDTSNMDDWRFPVGTKLWKEFTRDGVKAETRLLEKVRDAGEGNEAGAWLAGAYVHDGDDAVLSVDGAENVNGTGHDVPAADRCVGCHGGRASFVLGFSAVQLARDNFIAPRAPAEGDLDLDGLIAAGLLTAPPAAAPLVPGDDVTRRALGYVQANCAHCHNQARPGRIEDNRCFDPENDIDFFLTAEDCATGDPTRSALFRTAVGESSEGRPFARGNLQESYAISLMSRRFIEEDTPGNPSAAQMPPLATELVDDDGVALLSAFVAGL